MPMSNTLRVLAAFIPFDNNFALWSPSSLQLMYNVRNSSKQKIIFNIAIASCAVSPFLCIFNNLTIGVNCSSGDFPHISNIVRGGSRGGAKGASTPPFKIFCISFFHLIQRENIIQGCNKFYNHPIVHICIKCTIILRLTPPHCLNPTIKSITLLISIYEAKFKH